MHTRPTLLTTTHLTALAYANADNGTEFTTCLGRIVWGHPLKPQDKTKDDVKVLDSNGQPVKQWSFGVAFPKADFEAQVWPHFVAEAAKGYPSGVPGNFTYKYKDGDTELDAKGNPLSGKEGYAGCYIVAFSTELQPPMCFIYRDGNYFQIDENALKTGDHVLVKTNVKWHGPNPNARGSRPGLYVNPMEVLLMYEGAAISGSYVANPTNTFGAAPPQVAMPAGAAPVGAPAPGGSTDPGGAGAPGNGPGGAAMPPAPGSSAPANPAPPPPAPAAPAGPQRPTEPTHIHDNGNGTEQWFVNGAWDGGAHPVPAAGGPALPPPATGFVAGAGMPSPLPFDDCIPF